jgi:hypothetical protein
MCGGYYTFDYRFDPGFWKHRRRYASGTGQFKQLSATFVLASLFLIIPFCHFCPP